MSTTARKPKGLPCRWSVFFISDRAATWADVFRRYQYCVAIVEKGDSNSVFAAIRKRWNYGHKLCCRVVVHLSPCWIQRFEQKLVLLFLGDWTCIVIYRRLKYGRISCFGFSECCIHCVMFICQGSVSTTVLLKRLSSVTLTFKLFCLFFCGCEIWSRTLRKGCTRAGMRSKVFGPKMVEVRRVWMTVHSEELHELYSPEE